MEYKQFNNTYIVKIDKGEEIIAKLLELVKKENIKLGTVSAIGATDNVEMGLFDINEKKYYSKNYNNLYEITSLIGNITTKDDEPYLHLHINIADKDGKTFGGHLNKAIVSATCEMIITTIDGKINRKYDGKIGLNLLEL